MEFPRPELGAQRGPDVLHTFSIALVRNVFPQDGLWPGSEPNVLVNILAEASPLKE